MLFLNVSCGWIRTAAALSQKTAQKQPSGLFLAARLATSTRAHQDKTPRYVSLLALFFCGNPQSNPLFAGNYAKINKKKIGCHASHSHGNLFVTPPHHGIVKHLQELHRAGCAGQRVASQLLNALGVQRLGLFCCTPDGALNGRPLAAPLV